MTYIALAIYMWMAGIVTEWAHDGMGRKETVSQYIRSITIGITWPYWVLPIWWRMRMK